MFFRLFCFNSHLNKYLFRALKYEDCKLHGIEKNLSSYLDSVIDDSETVIINRDGNDAVVMISLEEYNAIKETAHLMQSPAMMTAIRRGVEDARIGKTISQRDGESISDFLDSI